MELFIGIALGLAATLFLPSLKGRGLDLFKPKSRDYKAIEEAEREKILSTDPDTVLGSLESRSAIERITKATIDRALERIRSRAMPPGERAPDDNHGGG